jgi:hypothetical protein
VRPILLDFDAGGMNKAEARYASHLELLKRAKNDPLVEWRFEPMKLQLAKRTWYTPDFLLVYPGHFEVHEFKGFWKDDARVKIKVAAQLYPWFKFVGVQEVPKKAGGGYAYEEFAVRAPPPLDGAI